MLALDPQRDLRLLRSVKLRSDERDTLHVRQRFEQALAAVDWTPAGLPPQALLLVRSMSVRASVARTADDRGIGEEVSRALRAHSRAARRPWLDPMAIDAPAVWFDEEHELAACLVRDWLRGDLSSRWWWRTVLGAATPPEWWRAQVLARGDRAVAVLARLAGQGYAVAWLKRMDEGDIAYATAAIARAYDAPLMLAQAPATRAARPGDARGPGTHRTGDVAASASEPMRARLVRIVPEVMDRGLPPAATRLLAYALIAVREPRWLRTQAFATTVVQWIADRDAEAASAVAPPLPAATDPEPSIVARRSSHIPDAARLDMDPRTAGGPATDTDAPVRHASYSGTPMTAPHATVDAGDGEAQARLSSPRASSSRSAEAAPVPMPRADDPSDIARTLPEAIRDTRVHAADMRSDPHVDTAMTPRETASQTHAQGAVDTAFGGLFYLLNAALALGLYGDFTAPRAPGLSLSPWDWLALIGRRWFGREFVRDPLWPLLASLAGRRRCDEPGVDFDAPSQWAISDAWLTPWASGGPVAAVRYRATARRLQVWHAEGFVLFDVRRDARCTPLVQARRLCASRRILRGAPLQRSVRAPARLPARNAGQRWLSWLLSYLQARLALALGGDASATGVAALLCRQPASVQPDTTTLQVRLSLAALPLPVRIAGLDRDPGWIPAAGRSLQFHFS